jgi:hypothetical protein
VDWTGPSSPELFQLVLGELTLWFDPCDFSYSIGEDVSIPDVGSLTSGGSTQNSTDYRINCKEKLL